MALSRTVIRLVIKILWYRIDHVCGCCVRMKCVGDVYSSSVHNYYIIPVPKQRVSFVHIINHHFILLHALLHNNNVKDSFTFRLRRLSPKVQLETSQARSVVTLSVPRRLGS